jgi:hypothetical protein
MSNNGISNLGDTAENFYRKITGATKPEKASLGDAKLNGYYIEIKDAGSDTLNQIRAVKYATLIAHDKRDDTWFVIPANQVIKTIIKKEKTRGQHTENPFESVTLSLKDLQSYKIDSANELRKKTVEAINEANLHPHLKFYMNKIIKDSKAMAQESIKDIEKYFDDRIKD